MKMHWCQGDTMRNALRITLCWGSAHSCFKMRNSHNFSLLWYKPISFKVTESGRGDGTAPAGQENAAESKHQSKRGGEREKGVLEALLPRQRTAFLPWTVNTAEVLCSPHTQLYSPVSSTSRSRISSSAAVSSCLILYFSLGFRALSPFFHSTGTPTALSWQRRVAVPPSVASLFFSPSLKNAGKAEGQQYQQWDVAPKS